MTPYANSPAEPPGATTVTVEEADHGTRLDIFASRAFAPLTRSQAQRHIDAHAITVNDAAAPPRKLVQRGERVTFAPPPPTPAEPQPQNIPLDVLYEDQHLIVIAKPAGLVVHPAAGHDDGTLVNALLHHVKDLSGVGGVMRPGIVHRLDRDTSGVMVVTKSDAAHTTLSRAFADRHVEKTYLCITYGVPKPEEGDIDAPIERNPNARKLFTSRTGNGRPAITHYRVVAVAHGLAIVEVHPRTGRTHQIRVHLSDRNTPIVADPLYTAERRINSIRDTPTRDAVAKLTRTALHALAISFQHPVTRATLRFTAPVPEDMLRVMQRIEPAFTPNAGKTP